MKCIIIFITFALFAGTYGTDCPDSWLAFQGSCYLFGFGKPMTFYSAEAYCRQHHGGHLLHIEDAYENTFVKDYLKHLKADNWWLGLTDEVVEGYWQWYDTDTPVTFSNWHPGQLDDAYGGEDCGTLWSDFGFDWADLKCTQLFEAICEVKADQAEIVG